MVDFIGINNVAALPEASHTDIGVNSFPFVKLKRINFFSNSIKPNQLLSCSEVFLFNFSTFETSFLKF